MPQHISQFAVTIRDYDEAVAFYTGKLGFPPSRDACAASSGDGARPPADLYPRRMAFIPKGARWYLAEIVERIRVEGDKRSVVHINTVLIEAHSPEVAFRKAVKRGRSANMAYTNLAGKRVTSRYLGLRELNVIHDPLEDGCEVAYEERIGMTDAASRKIVRARSALGVFRPTRPSTGPDYADAAIMAEVVKKLRRARRLVGPRRPG